MAKTEGANATEAKVHTPLYFDPLSKCSVPEGISCALFQKWCLNLLLCGSDGQQQFISEVRLKALLALVTVEVPLIYIHLNWTPASW